MKALIYIKDHLKYWAETYLGFPLAILLISASLHLYSHWTGYKSTDSPNQLVDVAYNAFTAIIIMALTGFCQKQLFGYRSKAANPKLCDDIYDSCVTVVLLLLFSYLVFHK